MSLRTMGANMSHEHHHQSPSTTAGWVNGRGQDKRVAFLAQVSGREGGREGVGVLEW